MSLAPAPGYRSRMPPALTGHCSCGAVRFEIDEPLLGAVYCHCTRCQRRTGSGASATALAPPGTIRVIAGEDSLSAWDPGGGGWIKEFCSVCGGHLFVRAAADPDQRGVRLGVIDGDPGVRPMLRKFTSYAAVWEPIPDDGLERLPDNMSV